ncbi:MAG: Gfo/Idh/MocA family oxidoreductase [Alphaproteobacteria bacterium]|nr:Gfo/Idh/MocA family oxidoreductase [Alphaproteobacteria bacterium]MCW5738705.1 Gfo/Idh/MocA family oxidoreductase [Alphaproteobacteria bacterium]
MRVVVVGMGVQGAKRRAAAGSDVVATVDPVQPADYRSLADVPPDSYDAALLCVPDGPKLALMFDLARRGKHLLVEKPVLGDGAAIERVIDAAAATGAVCYTAYNHRFEPHFVRMKALVDSGALGRLYSVRLFYGNGTARLVRDSAWRDTGSGVLADLGSHLLDTIHFWLGAPEAPFSLTVANRFENRSPDHVVLSSAGSIAIQLEMTMLSWRNHFTCDVLAEHGSAHIESLCKWGPSTFRHRRRVLPAGRPPEESVTLVQDDPTWAAEYAHFKALCRSGGPGNLKNDVWISATLRSMEA